MLLIKLKQGCKQPVFKYFLTTGQGVKEKGVEKAKMNEVSDKKYLRIPKSVKSR